VGSTTTSFVWAGGNVLDDGTQYVYGAGLVEHVTAGGTYWYLNDGSGSTVALVNSSGTVAQSYAYDAYGNVTSSSGSASTEYQYGGQQTDPTGLQYLRARYYDPATGRLLSRDPSKGCVFDPATHTPYTYAGDNPVTDGDPSGMTPSSYLDYLDASISNYSARVANAESQYIAYTRAFSQGILAGQDAGVPNAYLGGLAADYATAAVPPPNQAAILASLVASATGSTVASDPNETGTVNGHKAYPEEPDATMGSYLTPDCGVGQAAVVNIYNQAGINGTSLVEATYVVPMRGFFTELYPAICVDVETGLPGLGP
jgi:RHS repeat-associated protein